MKNIYIYFFCSFNYSIMDLDWANSCFRLQSGIIVFWVFKGLCYFSWFEPDHLNRWIFPKKKFVPFHWCKIWSLTVFRQFMRIPSSTSVKFSWWNSAYLLTRRLQQQVMALCLATGIPKDWEDQVSWGTKYLKGTSPRVILCKLSWWATIYHLWIQRNNRIYGGKVETEEKILKFIKRDIRGRMKESREQIHPLKKKISFVRIGVYLDEFVCFITWCKGWAGLW